MYQIATFGSWPQSIHDDPEQQKRINSATGSAVSPDSVDSEKQMCFISGSGKIRILSGSTTAPATTFSAAACPANTSTVWPLN